MNGFKGGLVQAFQLAQRFQRVVEARHQLVVRLVEADGHTVERDIGRQFGYPAVEACAEIETMRAAVGEKFDDFDFVRVVGRQRRIDGDVMRTSDGSLRLRLRLRRQNTSQERQAESGQPERNAAFHELFLFNNGCTNTLFGQFGSHAVDFVKPAERAEANAIPHFVLQHHLLHRCFHTQHG